MSWVELIDINLVDNLLIDVALIATLTTGNFPVGRTCGCDAVGRRLLDETQEDMEGGVRQSRGSWLSDAADSGQPNGALWI